MSDTVMDLAQELARALQPFAAALESPEFLRDYLVELGWDFATAPDSVLALRAPIDAAYAAVSDPSATSDIDGTQLLVNVGQAFDAIQRIGTDATLPDEFRAEFPRQLVDHLVVGYLLTNRERIGFLLYLLGIISVDERAASGTRVAFVQHTVAWDRLGPLLRDPLGQLSDVYHWGASDFVVDRLMAGMAGLASSLGVRVREGVTDTSAAQQLNTGAVDVSATSDFALHFVLLEDSLNRALLNAGVSLVALPETASAKPGFALLPFATAGLDEEVALSEQLSLRVRGTLDLAGGAGLLVRPGQHPNLVLGLTSASPSPATGQLAFQLRKTNGATPTTVIGSPDASRLEVGSVSTTAGVRLTSDEQLDAFVELAMDESSIVVKPNGDADSFLASLLPPDGIRIGTNVTVGFSSARGLYFAGGGDLEINLPVHARVGPIEIESALIALRPTDGAVAIDLAATIRGAFGPLVATVENIGLRGTLAFPSARDGNLGPLQFDLGFRAPDGAGVSLDAHGIVTGGGFLAFDPAQGSYAGVMQLSLHDELTLTAYGLVATRLPDGRPGYSVLVFITADGFQPIQLGLGFVLQSIGGMVGINRTFDVGVLQAGLKSDTLGTLLFPRDPVGNAPALLQALGRAFPVQPGSLLVGLLARITWFTPTLVTLDLALILELGARTRLLVLGRVSALLPSAENDLIRIVLDAMGVLDFDAGTLAIDAVLVDSRLVHRFPITGAAAVRAGWGDAPANSGSATSKDFVLAVGGLHPRYRAPAGFPALERVAIALCSGDNPRLVCEAYFGVTANTVQFGARASLYASAGGFSLEGDVGFDALVTLLPPHFLVDFHATVQLKRGSHNLFKLSLAGTLEGPLPLRLRGKVTFEILWVSFTVRVDATLVDGGVADAGLAAVLLENEVKAALAAVANWRTQRAPGVAHGVALRAAATTNGPVLDPLGQLVVTQQVVPLNLARDVDVYGGAPVAGRRRFALAGQLNTTAGTPVPGTFAPARYFALSEDDKLAAPSFEAMDAGLVLGDASVRYATTPQAVVPAPLEYAPITLNPAGAPVAPDDSTTARYALPVDALRAQASSGAAARAPVRQVGRARFQPAARTRAVTSAAPAWAIVRSTDGAVAPAAAAAATSVAPSDTPGGITWSEQREAQARLNRGDAQWVLVPQHELVA